ncbi:MAG: hypothetical protein M3R45_16400 [Pseudomonadota bacterium]|nr:hypothetical protein [Pseudomonadota bacterium]
MPDPQKPDERLIHCKNRWLQVCRSRGTPAPDQGQVAGFLASLPEQEQAELDHTLVLCLNGREKHRELALLSWAAACTRPDFLGKVQAHGLACSGHALFGAGLRLMASGWDMSARIAQLANNPEDIATLRTQLPPQAPPLPQAEASIQPAPEAPARPVLAASVAAAGAFPPPVPAPQSTLAPLPLAVPTPLSAPVLRSAPAPAFAPTPAPAPVLEPEPEAAPPPLQPLQAHTPTLTSASAAKPGRAKRQGLAPVQHIFDEEAALPFAPPDPDDPDLAAFTPPGRLQVRLFGRESAHTLEIGPHRRGASFMGVHVVTIESAHALPDGSGYDWSRKLMLQLTPEEMPPAIAVLMNLSASARFAQHGAERDKFVELRRQEGGMVLVTGQGGAVHAVPLKTGALYYVLSLFCRAMARGLPGSSVAEVMALVKAAHG